MMLTIGLRMEESLIEYDGRDADGTPMVETGVLGGIDKEFPDLLEAGDVELSTLEAGLADFDDTFKGHFDHTEQAVAL